MNLDGWVYLFEFGHGLFVYAKGAQRVGVNKDGQQVIAYTVGPDKSPRCEECLAIRVCNDVT